LAVGQNIFWEYIGIMGRTGGSIIVSVVVSMAMLFSSAVAAVIVAIVVAIKRQPPKRQLDGADA
jgi:ABC-type arginine/histidine transport system permease subunit